MMKVCGVCYSTGRELMKGFTDFGEADLLRRAESRFESM